MRQTSRGKARVKHHWRPDMIDRMRNNAKDARRALNPWHIIWQFMFRWQRH
jgi:hypothetical protein